MGGKQASFSFPTPPHPLQIEDGGGFKVVGHLVLPFLWTWGRSGGLVDPKETYFFPPRSSFAEPSGLLVVEWNGIDPLWKGS